MRSDPCRSLIPGFLLPLLIECARVVPRRAWLAILLLGAAGCSSEEDPAAIRTSYDAAGDITTFSTQEVTVAKNWYGGTAATARGEYRCPGQQKCTPEKITLRITTRDTDSHRLELIYSGKRRDFGEVPFDRTDSFFSTSDISTADIPWLVFQEIASAKRVDGRLGDVSIAFDETRMAPFRNLAAQAGNPDKAQGQ